METFQQIVDYFKQLPPSVLLIMAAAVALLLLGIKFVFRKPPSHVTAFSGESGSVMVSRKALQDLIKRTCSNDEWVEAARPTVRISSAKVHTKVELRLAAPDNLKSVTERLQRRITELLQRSLSFDQIGEIQIVVTAFGAAHIEEPEVLKQLEPPKNEEPDAPSFSGSGDSKN